MAAWMGAGGQEDQKADGRVGTFNPTLPTLPDKGRDGGLE